MANQILTVQLTPKVWAGTGYSSTGSGYTQTSGADITLTSIASAAARQGTKLDLGATRADKYGVRVGIEMDVAPVAGTVVEFYWSASGSGTAGTGNDGGASGTDAAYKAGEEDEWKKQLILLGVLVLTADAAPTVQMQTVGIFSPPERYGSPVVVNKGGQAFEGDAVEMFIALVPIVPEVQ